MPIMFYEPGEERTMNFLRARMDYFDREGMKDEFELVRKAFAFISNKIIQRVRMHKESELSRRVRMHKYSELSRKEI